VTWRPLPDHTPPPPRRVGESLDRLARSLGAPSAAALDVVFRRWPELAGPASAHSRPLWLADGALVVAVDAPAHATDLRYRAAQVLAAVEEALGERVADRLEVRVRPRR
jgi:predicted nucleic acid-binding Zn ribbon protein